MNLRRKRLRLMRDTQWRGYARTAEGNPITLSQVRSLANLSALGNSTQDGTPSPDNPVEVVGSGERTANLFDISKISGDNIKVVGSEVYLNGYACATSISPEKFLEITGLKVGDEITTVGHIKLLNGIFNGAQGRISFLKKDNSATLYLTFGRNSDGQTMYSTLIPSDFNDDTYRNMYLYGTQMPDENGNQLAIMSNVAIYKSKYTTETLPLYEPYGYKVSVTAHGRNLFDINSIISNNNITNNGNEIVINAKRVYSNLKPSEFMEMTGLKPGDKFTSRCKTNVTAGTDGSACGIIFINNSSGAAVYIFYGYSVKTISIPADFSDNKYSTLVFDGVENGDSTFANLMVVKGAYTAETLPPYEPYKEPQEFNIYTPTPLYGIGDSHDMAILDFDKHRATLISNIVRYVIGDNWGLGTNGKNIVTQRFYQSCEGTLINNARIISNTFEEIYPSSIEIVNADEEGANVSNTRYLQIKINKSRLNTVDVTGFKEWISNYESINGELQFYGEAYNPTTTDITALQDWDTMPQLTGTWILTANGGTEPTLTAEYYSNERSTE